MLSSALGHIGLRIKYLFLCHTGGMDTGLKYQQSSSSSVDWAVQWEDRGKRRNVKQEQKRVSASRREQQRNLADKKGNIRSNELLVWKTWLTGWVCWLLQTPAVRVNSLTLSVTTAAAAIWSQTSLSVWGSWKLEVCDVIDEQVWVSPGLPIFTLLPVWADTGAEGLWCMTTWFCYRATLPTSTRAWRLPRRTAAARTHVVSSLPASPIFLHGVCLW